MDALDELARLLRPMAGGLHLVSTGRAEQLALQQRLYGVPDEAGVRRRFLESLDALRSAKVVVLGVPSDVGAGFRRGANLGPGAIRATLIDEDPTWPERCRRSGVVDVGDVFVVPQLLHDEMLGEAQLEASRRALYPDLDPALASRLPVSPLSIEERVLDLIFALNPGIRPLILGGDHSTAWPCAAALARVRRAPWGIVQPDAHTDLLSERLGIKYCFATWSFHANELIGRGGRLVQVGTRASGKPREHWERTLGVRQFWAEECRARPEATLDAIVDHLRRVGVQAVYFSNDIDGTDEAHADATGTPEPAGLHPDFVVALIQRLGRELDIVAGDVMEVAPPLESASGGARRTLALAARYVRETVSAMLGASV